MGTAFRGGTHPQSQHTGEGHTHSITRRRRTLHMLRASSHGNSGPPTHAHAHKCMHTCTHKHAHIHITPMCTRTHTSTHTKHTRVHTRTHTHKYTHTKRAHTCAHAHIHARTHTCVHMASLREAQRPCGEDTVFALCGESTLILTVSDAAHSGFASSTSQGLWLTGVLGV